ncbi:MAG: hypothetical protein M1823_001578 [Watsoniomyces obsoletus]|nr:MAG: hypothetical protein M1823_001578 [Watsoniomyces obsoletus]
MAARLHSSDVKSTSVRKAIEKHKFEDEAGDEYEGSRFGGFPEYFRRKKIKLQNLDVELRSKAQDAPPIFRGVVAHVNGYTQPSLNDLHKLIVTHGGGFLQYLDGKTVVTHIIASNLTPKKRVEFRRYRIVKPAWVVDSVNAGTLLPWDNYRVIDEGRHQKVLGFNDGKVVSQVSEHQRSYKSQTEGSWYTNQIQKGQESQDDGDHFVASSQEGTEEQSAEGAPIFPEPQSDGNSEPPAHLDPGQGDDELSAARASAANTEDNEPRATAGDENEDLQEVGLPLVEDDDLEHDAWDDNADEAAEERHTPPTRPPPKQEFWDRKNLEQTDSTESSRNANMTAEEHNSILLQDPYIRKSSAANPDFIRQYYSESRLHHLSTWKANLKSQLQRMAAELSPSQKASQKRPPGARRYILHVDFDCFFAAVSLKSAPQYKDKPVVVAHGTGTGSEIASCNYVAREFGIKNGMWMKQALKLCPDIKVLPYNYEGYEEASKEFYRALLATGGVVQSVSVDEALVDITNLCLPAGGSHGTGISEGSIWREQAKAQEIANAIRKTIEESTGCAVSVGIGGNILLAKIALRKAKPAGQYLLQPEDVLDFIGELTVQSLPGVAHSIGGKLEEHGVKYVKDVRGLSKEKLMSVLGPKTGEKIWEYSRGIDRTEVGSQVERKSVSAEVNWGIRFENQAQADAFIHSLCGELHRRLLEQRVKGRQLTVKIMRRSADTPLDPPKHLGHGKCDTYNKSVMLGVATNAQDVLAKESLSVLKSYGFTPGDLRGIGLQVTKLEPLKSNATEEESSQRRLKFEAARPTTARKAKEDEKDQESIAAPTLARAQSAPAREIKPIQKPFKFPGTQFAIPSQVDPAVLAELPEDIRAKLSSTISRNPQNVRPVTRSSKSRSRSPLPQRTVLPSESQLDQETLAALPEDVRKEVLAAYQRDVPRAGNQTLLPQSPRKTRTIQLQSKKITTPTKKRTGLLSRGRGKLDSTSTLTQSNFLARLVNTGHQPDDQQTTTGGSADEEADDESISSEFLNALPEEIRREVLAEQRRNRQKRHGNLDIGIGPSRNHSHRPVTADSAEDEQEERRLSLPPRPPKATFTNEKISALPELRMVISNWVAEFSNDGPYEEDVDALAHFLGKVVLEDHGLDKAVALVKWLIWVKDDGIVVRGAGRTGWDRASKRMVEAVQTALKTRRLGPVDLG